MEESKSIDFTGFLRFCYWDFINHFVGKNEILNGVRELVDFLRGFNDF